MLRGVADHQEPVKQSDMRRTTGIHVYMKAIYQVHDASVEEGHVSRAHKALSIHHSGTVQNLEVGG